MKQDGIEIGNVGFPTAAERGSLREPKEVFTTTFHPSTLSHSLPIPNGSFLQADIPRDRLESQTIKKTAHISWKQMF